MKPGIENFEELQKLLAMKRHEQPPPRFFCDFADKVLERLNTPEPERPLTWRERLGLDFDLKPAFVCVWGVLLCSSLVLAVTASVQLTEQPVKQVGGISLVQHEPVLVKTPGSTEPVVFLGP